MKELHILSEGINFPVAIPIYTDWQGTQIRYLLENVRTAGFGSYAINLSKQAKKTKLFKIRHVKRTTLKKLAFRGYVDANFVSLCGYC